MKANHPPRGVDGWPPGPSKGLDPGPSRAWARALVGPPGPLWAPRALVGRALVGPYGPGPCGPPWALMGPALMGPPDIHMYLYIYICIICNHTKLRPGGGCRFFQLYLTRQQTRSSHIYI